MKATWMAVLAIALLFSGCTDKSEPKTQPGIQKVGKDVFFLEVEDFGLTDAKVQKFEGASGGKVVVLKGVSGKAEASVQLSKGNYEITVYALGPSKDEDGFYLTVGDNAKERRWPKKPGKILPTLDVNFTQEADGPCDILLRFAEPNVQLDRVQFKHVPYMKTLSKHTSAVEWVTIPGGTFMMGSKSGGSDEKPVHRVTVKAFQMTKTEVTFGQYRKCIKAGACTPGYWDDLSTSFNGKDQPVVRIDWNQAKAFSKWAGGRLPTKAEWEYAARSAGKDQKYPWGNEKATCDRVVMSDGGHGCGRKATWPVCSKPRGNTDQGLCDMAGNVWEWVEDWYHNSYKGAPTDGSAWVSPTGSFRVIRGGSWRRSARDVRVATRGYNTPGTRCRYLGFRPARSP